MFLVRFSPVRYRCFNAIVNVTRNVNAVWNSGKIMQDEKMDQLLIILDGRSCICRELDHLLSTLSVYRCSQSVGNRNFRLLTIG